MFQSPLKTISEKVRPVSSKSSVSSLNFDRISDFKKFINFIKKETKELENIPVPKVPEVRGKLKKTGFLGLGFIGLLALLGGGGEGDGDGEEKKRFGLAGGTESQFKDIDLPLIRGLKRVPRDLNRPRSKKSLFRESLNRPRKQIVKKLNPNISKKEEGISPLKERVARRQKRLATRKNKIIQMKSALKDLTDPSRNYREIRRPRRGRKIIKKFPTQETAMEKFQRVIKEIQNETDPEIKARLQKQLLDEVALPVEEFEKQQFAKYTDAEMKKIKKLFSKQAQDIELQKIEKSLLAAERKELREMKSERYAFKRDPKFKFKFKKFGMNVKVTPKDALDKMFIGIGKKTKTFRDSLSAGFSKIPIPKKVVSIAKPFLKKGAFVFDFATAGVELYKMLEGFVVGDNILTSFYDLGVSIHNTFQPDKTKLITYITNSRDSRLKAITDQKNQKILSQIQQARQAQASNNNISPTSNQSNIIPEANKKKNGGQSMIPFSPQYGGLLFIMEKLYKQ